MASANRFRILAPVQGSLGSNPAFNNFTLDASGKKIAAAFAIPHAATITHLGFRYGVRTGTPPTYRISLQSLDGGGLPDGTVLGGGSPASKTFTPPADATWNSTWQWQSLDNSYVTARGQILAWVIDYSSGTVDGSNNSSFTEHDDTGFSMQIMRTGFPHALDHNGTSWTKRNPSCPIFGAKSASNVYGTPVESAGAVNVTTTGHRVALRFALPSGWGDTFQIVGARWTGMFAAGAAGTVKMGLWDASSELQAVTIDNEHTLSPGSAARSHEYYFDEASLTALSFGTEYYLGLERVDSNNDPELNCWQVDSSNELKAFAGGDTFYLATYNGTSWSADQTRRPSLELIVDDWTEPAGGSGGGIRLAGHGGLAA